MAHWQASSKFDCQKQMATSQHHVLLFNPSYWHRVNTSSPVHNNSLNNILTKIAAGITHTTELLHTKAAGNAAVLVGEVFCAKKNVIVTLRIKLLAKVKTYIGWVIWAIELSTSANIAPLGASKATVETFKT